jgi:YD repeat-containing protein
VNLSDPNAADHTELYARFGAPPTRVDYDYVDSGAGPNHCLVIPNGAPGTWYFLVYAESAAAGHSFTILAASSPLVIQSLTPDHYGTGAAATLTLTGAGFDHTTTASLVGSGSITYAPTSVTVDTYTQLTATFNLAGVSAGTYGVRVNRADGASFTLPNAFTVTAAGPANFQTHLILPSALGRHAIATLYVQYSNTGNVAMPAPLLILDNTNGQRPLLTLDQSLLTVGLWTSALPTGFSNTITILASGKTPGLLEPGESVTVPVYYAGLQQPWDFSKTTVPFELLAFSADNAVAIDWSSLESSLQPSSLSATAWHPIFQNVTTQAGNTIGGYVQMLDNEATYLGSLGEDVSAVSKLWGAAVQQADGLSPIAQDLAAAVDDSLPAPGSLPLSFGRAFGGPIDSRNTFGPLGYGWSTSWQTSLATLPDGTVIVTGQGGSQRRFQPDSRTTSSYFSEIGDTTTLTKAGDGTFTLTDDDGTMTHFRADGKLDYFQDTNGNRITAGYNVAGQLTTLTASSGQSLALVYNAAGLISSVTDSFGRQVTYTYDASNQHLLSVATPQGTTQYTYSTGGAVFTNHALTSIAFPDGTHEFFTYTTEGHLASISKDGGADTLTYSYNLGEITTTDALNNSSVKFFNEFGLVAKTQDALGNITTFVYNRSTLLVSQITDPMGQTQNFKYDGKSDLISSTDQFGHTTFYTYGPNSRITSLTDANGNRTTYQYDASGNLLSTTYPDGSVGASIFNPLGEPISFVNRNGQAIASAYNANGQLKQETFPDGGSFAYTFDSHGNLLTATDATGATTFTYNAADELTNVTYPDGTFLLFTLDAAGRRIQMVQGVGATRFTVNYHYDAAGRLSGLTDGSGNPIVTYTYNAAGQLTRKDNGNGTSTTYVYDANGNVLYLVLKQANPPVVGGGVS